MYLRNTVRNMEGAGRTANLTRSDAARRTTANPAVPRATTAPPSRGAFFDMLNAQVAPTNPSSSRPVPAPARTRSQPIQTSAARPLSTGDNSSVRGGSRTLPTQGGAVRSPSVRTRPAEATDPATTPPATTPPATTPPATTPPATTPPVTSVENAVEVLNELLRKLGFEPANFGARITSTRIDVPGILYEYPMLEVTVNGERLGFHLPSVVNDPRMTAANISSMMGKPVMNFAAFA